MGFSVKRLSTLCLAGFVALGLAACGPFGGATPTATVPPPTATIPPTAVPSLAPSSAPTGAPTAAATAVASAAPSPSIAPATATAAPPTAAPPTATTSPPTATLAPSATATAAPTATSTAVPVPPTVPPTLAPTATLPPPPPSAPGSTVNDPQGRCALTLPTGFAASGTAGLFTGAGGRATVMLAGLVAAPGDTLDDVALPFISTATAGIADYQQLRAVKGTDSLRIDYTGRMAQPGTGTFFLRQFGRTVCALSFFVVQGTEFSYEPTLAQLLASLRVVGAVGIRPR